MTRNSEIGLNWQQKHFITEYDTAEGTVLPTDVETRQGHCGVTRILHHPRESGERERRETLWRWQDRLPSTCLRGNGA